MMKKILGILPALMVLVATAVALTACSDDEPEMLKKVKGSWETVSATGTVYQDSPTNPGVTTKVPLSVQFLHQTGTCIHYEFGSGDKCTETWYKDGVVVDIKKSQYVVSEDNLWIDDTSSMFDAWKIRAIDDTNMVLYRKISGHSEITLTLRRI